MANDGILKFITEIDTSGFKQGIDKFKKSWKKAAEEYNGKIEDTKGEIVSLRNVAKITGAVLAGKLFKDGLTASTEFEKGLAKVSTMFGDVDVDTKNLSKAIKDLSNSTGIATSELNEGLYSSLSAGIPVTKDMGKAMEFLETSTMLAKGGFTTTEKSVDALTTVLNGYKMETSEASKVADILLQTQNKGKTTVDELASSLAQVTPTAAAMNVSFEQVGSALATMTAQGIPTSQATTMLNQLFAELGKEGTTASNALSEATANTQYAGMSFQDLMAKGVPLNEILDLMSGYASDNNKSLLDMFGSIEAGKSALALSGENAQTYTDNLESMKASSGEAKDASDKMNSTLDTQLDKLKRIVENKASSFFDGLKDAMSKVLPFAIDLLTNFEKYETPLTLIGIGLGTVTGLLAAYKIQQALANKGLTLWQAVAGIASGVTSALAGAFAFLTSPIGLIILAIGAVIAIGYLLIKNWDKVKETVLNVWNGIKEKAIEIWDGIKNFFIDLWNGIKEKAIEIWNGIKNFFIELWDGIVKIFSKVWDNIKLIFQKFNDWLANVFSIDWTKYLGSLGEVFNIVFDTIESVWGSIKGIFSGIIDFVKNVFTGNWRGAWESIVNIFGSIFSGLGALIKAPLNAVISIVNSAIGALNKISVDIPDWVPLVGGQKFGINIPKIPLLEKGGVLAKGQIGLLEGNGAEAVVPLERNKHWINAVAKDFIKAMPQIITNNKEQVVNFYQPVQSPDEISRMLRINARMGLIG